MILLLVLLGGRDGRQFEVALEVVSNFYSYSTTTKEGDLELVCGSFVGMPERDQGRRLGCRRSDGSRAEGSTKTVSFVPKDLRC